MTDKKITDLTAPTTSPVVATGDVFEMVDVNDTSGGTAGTSRKVTVTQLKAGLGVPTTANTAATGLTAAGTTQGTALAITTETSDVTTVASGTGVVLAAYVLTGARQTVRNRGANVLKVYPPASTGINGLSNNVAVTIPPGGGATFVWVSSTLLVSIEQASPDAAQVATLETQAAATAYGNLATTGPTVTMVTGTSVIVFISMLSFRAGSGNTAYMSIDISGATTVAAADSNSIQFTSPGSNFGQNVCRPVLITGLTAGSNTFTAKYRNDGGTTWSFVNRSMLVIPLN